jgi:hypothetical protein
VNEADGVAAEDGTADTDDDTSEGEENAQVEKLYLFTMHW